LEEKVNDDKYFDTEGVSLYYESGVQAPPCDNVTSPISLTTIRSGERVIRSFGRLGVGISPPERTRTRYTRESPRSLHGLQPTTLYVSPFPLVDSCGMSSAIPAPPSSPPLPIPSSHLRVVAPNIFACSGSQISWRAHATADLNASRPLIRVLVINDNHCGLTFLFEL
jgi:hypothetical protein